MSVVGQNCLEFLIYVTVFSYFFLSKIARTLKYAGAVPVGICNYVAGNSSIVNS